MLRIFHIHSSRFVSKMVGVISAMDTLKMLNGLLKAFNASTEHAKPGSEAKQLPSFMQTRS
jgi:hypothetical protein